MSNLSILDLLRSDGSIVVNKKLAHILGLNEAVIYAELVSLHQYWAKRNELTEDGWFFCTIENLEENTSIKRDTQARTIAKLEKKWKLIETKRMGLPARRYFRITEEILNLISNKITQKAETDSTNGSEGVRKEEKHSNPHGCQIPQNQQTELRKISKQDSAKSVSNNTIINNTIINNTDSKESIYLSRVEELNNVDAPMKVKQVLKKNMDRLIDDQISLTDIDLFYNSTANDLNDHDFSIVLNNVLSKTKSKIKDITNVLTYSIENYYLYVIRPRETVETTDEETNTYQSFTNGWLRNSSVV